MGNFRPLQTKCWVRFIELHGFKFNRIKGSHHMYTKKGSIRSIPVWGSKKEIPAGHLKTGCFTLGISMENLYNWADQNC